MVVNLKRLRSCSIAYDRSSLWGMGSFLGQVFLSSNPGPPSH